MQQCDNMLYYNKPTLRNVVTICYIIFVKNILKIYLILALDSSLFNAEM